MNLFDILGLDTYLLFCGDEAGVPFRDAAMAQKTSIEAKQRDATVLIIDVRTFDDVQKALKEAICIKEIHFYVHSGPGIIFLDMNSRSAESNISELGGRHVIPQSHFERGFEPISFASRGVASLYTGNMKKTSRWRVWSRNKVYVHGCNSQEIAQCLGRHFRADSQGVSGTCYYPRVNGKPIPSTGLFYFWLLFSGQTESINDGQPSPPTTKPPKTKPPKYQKGIQ